MNQNKIKAQTNLSNQTDNRVEQQILIVKKSVQKTQVLQVYEYQVSGKTPKYIDNVNGLIYKQFSSSEYQFYEIMRKVKQTDPRSKLKIFLPEYMGIHLESQFQEKIKNKQQGIVQKETEKSHRNLWVGHISSRTDIQPQENKFICLGNLTFKFQNPNILDIKLGRKKTKKSNIKFQNSTTNSHCFRINGMIAQLHNGDEYQQCFISKYFGQKITVKQIENYLSLFFFNGESMNQHLLTKVIKLLGQLIESVNSFNGVKFISSSLFIAFDANNPQHFQIKLIDFDKYQLDETVSHDANILEGLNNIHMFLNNIRQNIEIHEEILVKKQLNIFNQDVLIIPESVIEKYKPKKAEEEELVI